LRGHSIALRAGRSDSIFGPLWRLASLHQQGLGNGDTFFSGTGNVFNSASGSVTGTLFGLVADGVYYRGNDGETFDIAACGRSSQSAAPPRRA
jgi:hypothetical protein